MVEPDTETSQDGASVLGSDPVLAAVMDRHDLDPLEPAENEFKRLCVSIINQQLSSASAAAVRDRVFSVLDDEVTPDAVLTASSDDLRDAGLSRTKVDFVRNAARAFLERDLTRSGLADHADDEVRAELTRIAGVGPWTARMYLIFVLQRPDVLPLGDLAVRRGIETLYNDGQELTRAEMREIARPWRPHRSLATRYVWAEYES
ncbi:DNA-3-methyladenine glycosylase 2 family protein [Natrarchaeobius halalkaliphilus]|uniref:DNA-3-methyladenine glycosylase 2 family protein n=1 Tax=Natrarchaeobius halalkaliphilus TaxID=1679091 RepID=A0A3N6P4F4_9EURY|nr:DNA-3-methyladenine glycosylase [Natrarchaeobius halalkaliphilus]RQG90265.1 DNA-3-methyladenine glycosylase 2 family protein [Natrarchaeobius halalkaliphilus]